MKKIFSIIILSILMSISITSYANLYTKTKPTRENLLEDAVISLLQPHLGKAIKDHYGTTYNIGTYCEKVIDIKKLDHPGSWLFEAKLEFATYTGAHNIKDIFTVTVKQDWGDINWVLKDYKVRKYDPKEKFECRSPA